MSVPDVPVLLIMMGGILFFVAVVGGGIKSKWVEFQQILSNRSRIASGTLGVILIGAGIYLSVSVFKTSGSTHTVQEKPSPEETKKKNNRKLFSINGNIYDIFGNPRSDVVVIVQGSPNYGITNKKGDFSISNILFQDNLTLQARYGSVTDEMVINISKNATKKEIVLSEPMILNPIKLETALCKKVDIKEETGLKPIGIFEDDNVQISLNSLDSDEKNKIIWCFVKVIGPAKYEIGKKTDLSFEWYLNDQLQSEPFKSSVGVSPYGWRTRASKIVWVGKWRLKIVTKHKELANIPFEIYK